MDTVTADRLKATHLVSEVGTAKRTNEALEKNQIRSNFSDNESFFKNQNQTSVHADNPRPHKAEAGGPLASSQLAWAIL